MHSATPTAMNSTVIAPPHISAESVCSALTLAASELSRLEEELRQRERETGRITAALCLGGGAMLCILLL